MNSPYLVDPNRLADVIAAIQATGHYKFYKLDFEGWSDRITGDASEAEHWRKVFEEHPEFFRLDSAREKGSLLLRRQIAKRYNVDTGETISKDEFLRLGNDQRSRISRKPLEMSQISTLVSLAVDLHDRALERKRDRRWWIVTLAGFFGALLGGVLATVADNSLTSPRVDLQAESGPTLARPEEVTN